MITMIRKTLPSLTLLTSLSTGALFLTLTTGNAQEKISQAPAMITVSADGEITTKPDMAIINLSVITQGKNANESLTENNTTMAKIIDALKASGIEAQDLKTANFTLYPIYKNDQKPSSLNSEEIIGYRAGNTLSVQIRNIEKLGALLDETVKLGLNSSSELVLTNANPIPYLIDARKKAVIEARSRAETLAEAAGVKLGRVLVINEGGARFTPIQQSSGMANGYAISSQSVPIESGELTYNVTVTVTFEIEN